MRGKLRTVNSLLILVFCILLVFLLFRKFMGNSNIPTFSSFLEMLTTVKTPEVPFVSFSFTSITASWGVFDFLKDFLNLFVDAFNVILFLINGLISLASYVMFFCRWLFM